MVNKLALKQQWMDISQQWGADDLTANKWIDDLCARYEHPNRHYHDLSHIEHIFKMISTIKQNVESWDAIFFATWFHDAIQKIGVDNEGQSAKLAKHALEELRVPGDIISRTEQLILATKQHESTSALGDSQYFIDCDLSILGAHWPAYEKYKDGCRKEYKVPGFIYRKGRKKFLTQMLDKEHIFQSQQFREKYQANAKKNMRHELDLL